MMKLETKIPPLLLLIISALLMWALSTSLPDTPLPTQFRLITTAILLSLGLILFIISGTSFAKAKTTVNPMSPETSSSLVTSGIYKWTRNPMYVGCLLFLVAWGLILSNLFSLASSAFFVLYMNRFQIQPEERALESLFGEEYLAYKTQVRRWL